MGRTELREELGMDGWVDGSRKGKKGEREGGVRQVGEMKKDIQKEGNTLGQMLQPARLHGVGRAAWPT